jgi:hypothetical protein
MGTTSSTESRRKRTRARRQRQLEVDSLEGRRLMSAQIVNYPAAQAVAIYGDTTSTLGIAVQKDSNLIVAAKSASDTSATVQSFPASSVKYIFFFGSPANDAFINLSPISSGAFGCGGNDLLIGGSGADYLDGGDGNDIIIDAQGNNTVFGGNGNDLIITGSGNDTIDAGAGNDRVFAGPGNDHVKGGAGNDILLGGDGNDTIDGGADNDLILGQGGNDNLYGGDGNDWIAGGNGTNLLFGQGGNDFLFGGSGGNYLDGGDGNDVLVGGTGLALLQGGNGDDLLFGFPAVVYPSTGNDLQSTALFNPTQLSLPTSTDPFALRYRQFAATQVAAPLAGGLNSDLSYLSNAVGPNSLIAADTDAYIAGASAGSNGYVQELKSMGWLQGANMAANDPAMNGGVTSQSEQDALEAVGLSFSDLQRLNRGY